MTTATLQGPCPIWRLSIEAPQGWWDSSYGNDVCPSIQSKDGDYQIFVDEEDCFWMRLEGCMDSQRFFVFADVMEANEELGGADTLEEALEMVRKHRAASSAPMRLLPDAEREEVVICISRAIEGAPQYVASLPAVSAVMASQDVRATLAEQLPNCEWEQCFRNLREARLLIPSA